MHRRRPLVRSGDQVRAPAGSSFGRGPPHVHPCRCPAYGPVVAGAGGRSRGRTGPAPETGPYGTGPAGARASWSFLRATARDPSLRSAGGPGARGSAGSGIHGRASVTPQPQLPPHWQEPPLWQPQLHPEPQPQAPSSGTGISVTRGSRTVGVGDGVVGKSAMSTLPRLCWTYPTADPRRTRGGPADHWTPAAAGAATARESTRAARGERAPFAVRSRRPRPPPTPPWLRSSAASGLWPLLIRRDG